MIKLHTNSPMRGAGSHEAEGCPPGRVPSLPAAGPGRAIEANRAAGRHYNEVASSRWSAHKRCRTQNTNCYQYICIGSINTTPMKDPLKLAQCISQCKVFKHHITFMQETYIIGHKTTIFEDDELKRWTFINSGLKGKASAGVGIALSSDVKLEDIENIIEGRILLARIVLHLFQIFVHMLLRNNMPIQPKKHSLLLCKR